MSDVLSSLVSVPDITEEQKRTTQRMLRNILYIVIVAASLVALIDGIIYKRYSTAYALGPLAVASMISLYYLQRQIFWPARVVIPAGALIAFSYLLYVGNGLHDIAISGLPLVLDTGRNYTRRRSPHYIRLTTALAVSIVGIAEIMGYIPNSYGAVVSDIVVISIAIFAGAFLLRLLLTRLQHVIAELQQSERQQIQVNMELLGLKSSLENRVMERTRELEDRTGRS